MHATSSSEAFKKTTTILMYVTAVASLVSLWLAPQATFRLGIEDGPIENATALFLLIGSITMAIHGFKILSSGKHARTIAYAAFAVAIAFFVFAGEEISWGQRIFNIETGEFMQQYNWQNEMNLHNLHTDIANTGFHWGAFIFLIVLPIFQKQTKKIFSKLRLNIFSHFIAPTWLALPSFAIMGMLDPRFIFTIEKPWAAALYLSALGLGLIVLVYQLWLAIKVKDMTKTVLLFLSLFLIGFGLFVCYLQAYDNIPNTITEYKELLIGFGLCVFALQWHVKPASEIGTED